MKLFGFEITRTKQRALQSIRSNAWWSPLFGDIIHEPFTGAWQQNATPVEQNEGLLRFSAVYCCITGIATDIAKMRLKLIRRGTDGIWHEVEKDSPFLPILRKPNHYQTRIKFIEQWIVSKLVHGNAYILKQRDDARGLVTALYVLDPTRVTPLVADSGEVFYEIKADFLSQVEDLITVPASEMIHDTMVSFWHPLIGVPPLYACAMAATLGNKIQNASTGFFANRSMPGGVLTAPGSISDETAARLKAAFETNFTGANSGRLAVLGDGLKFEPMMMTAEHAQLAEQLKMSIEDVARAFHYPLHKLALPSSYAQRNVEADTVAYYTDCLQILIESAELHLDEGIALPSDVGVEFDLDSLWRMDTLALVEAETTSILGGLKKPNESRQRLGLAPTDGGDEVYLQQQNYSLKALAKRDAMDDPFGKSEAPTPTPPPPKPPDETERAFTIDELDQFESGIEKELATI